MQPDLYLQYAGALAALFLKVAAAYLLCRLLAQFVSGPGARFAIWLSFMFGSLAYWLYLATFLFPGQTNSGQVGYSAGQQVPLLEHQFFLPAGLQFMAIVVGKLLAIIYLAGTAILLALAIWKRARLCALLRQADEPSSGLKNMFDEMCRNFGIRKCELLVLDGISSPATVYWLRPRVLLPRNCEQLGAGDLMADIFCHELSHVARRDYLWSSLSDLICGVLFFHPAVWRARKQMRMQREMACDLVVVASRPEHRADYAYTLTSIARVCLARKYPVIGIDFAASASLLTNRVNAILNGPQETSWQVRISRSFVGLVLVGVYAFFCLTFAVTIVFAHTGNSPQTAPQSPPVPGSAQSRRALKPRREPASRPAQSMITESPAYRWQASLRSSAYTSAASGTSQTNTPSEVSASEGPGWRERRPAQTTLPSLRSIVLPPVGTAGGGDKDDHGTKGRGK